MSDVETYDMTLSDKLEYVWFRVPKACTRTIIYFFDSIDIIDFGFPPHRKSTLGYNKPYLDKWDDYFKFTFVRNPYSRLVSTYFDKCQKVIGTEWELPFYSKWKDASFYDFVVDVCSLDLKNTEGHIKLQSEFIPKKIDYIGKMETFTRDFDYVLNRISVKIPQPEKKHNTTEHNHWSEYYTNYLKDMVYDSFRSDFDNFSYEK